MARWLVIGGVAGGLACDEDAHYAEVSVTGVPRCEVRDGQGASLDRPVVIEVEDGTTKRFSGFAAQRAEMSVPVGRREHKIRFGQCQNRRSAGRSYECGRIQWYGRSTLTFDASVSGASIDVPAPPDSKCSF